MRLRPSLAAVLAAALLVACAWQPSPPPQNPVIGMVKASVPPRPDPSIISDVAFATPDRGWILLGEQSLATTDGGQTWRPAALAQPFESMSFTTPRLGHAILQQQLFRTTDGGDTWVPVGTAGWPNPNAFFIDERHGWSSGWQPDTFYRTQDGGSTWEKLPDPCPKDSRRPFSFINTTTGWLLCGFDEGMGAMSKTLYRTADGGRTWTLLGEALVGKNRERSASKEWPRGLDIGDYVSGVFFVDERHGWYTGARYGSFMATEDGGRTWQAAAGPSLQGGRVRFITRQVGYHYGRDSLQSAWVLSMSRDGGKTWAQVYPRRQPRERFYLDAQTYIGELDGDLYRSEDAGESWRLLSKLPAPLGSLSYTSREQAWALMGTEKERHLYRSADGGATWKRVAAVANLEAFQYVQGRDERTAILWDHVNQMLITRDGGISFTAAAAPQDQSGGHGFFFTSAETGWFSRGFQLYITADGGMSWQAIPLPDHWKAQGVTVGVDGRVWASIVDATNESALVLLTLVSGDGGRTWTRYDLGDFDQPWPVHRCGLSSICVDSGGIPYGIVSHDGGQTWRYYQR